MSFLEQRSMAAVAFDDRDDSPTPFSQFRGKRGIMAEQRKRHRFHIKASAQVTRLDSAVADPEIAPLVDASPDGVLFATDREYPVGTRVLVKFPYPSATSPKQTGSVVRVDALPDGSRHVAIAFRG